MTKPQSAETLLKLGDLSRLTNVPKSTLAQRFDRQKYRPSRHDQPSQGSGRHRQFSRDTINGIAIAQKLIELGVGVTPANKAASLFVDHAQPGRAAGKLFPQDQTLLVLRASGPVVINAPYYSDFADLADHGTAFVAIDCGKICREVDTALTKNNLK
jgi:hypothetical protein